MVPVIPSCGITKVAVIGAGPGGLAAAKYLVAEQVFSSIFVFEQRETVGGVWNATPHESVDRNFSIPRTIPSQTPNQPIWSPKFDRFDFISPIYDSLDTNIPHTLMNYSDLRFPEGSSLFPQHAVVREYLERYADEIRHVLRLGTQVLKVEPLGREKWSVVTRDIKTDEENIFVFDAVVVANGHYDDPYVPDIPGLKAFSEAYPGAISHSKFYRRPAEYRDKKVIIVGNSASGIDLSAQISAVSQHPLLVSEKIPSKADPAEIPNTALVPEISEFLTLGRAVRFSDGSIERDVDNIIFCTGYMYSFPFLTSLSPPPVSTGDRTQQLYQQIFYHPRPTLSFIGLPQRIVPFPLSEGQGAIIARVLSGRLTLPSPKEMAEWEEDLISERGAGKGFHILKFPLDAEYINFLHDWALTATINPNLENSGTGRIPPYWGKDVQRIREHVPLIKVASRKLGDERFKIKTLKELGFDFDEHETEV